MKNKFFLWLSLLITLSIVLYSCRNEELAKDETTPHRNNDDFFKHSKTNNTLARTGVDYISILEAYNNETNFLAQMPDQRGMPVWEKMQIIDLANSTRVFIPLSYDNETLSSVLAVAFDNENRVKALQDTDNAMLESFIYDPQNRENERKFWMDAFLLVDSKAFGTQHYTNLPSDLYTDFVHEEYNRMDVKEFEIKQDSKLMISTTCVVSWYCKSGKNYFECDAGNGCHICWVKTVCGTALEGDYPDDIPVIPGPGGGIGGGGGSPGTPTQQPPKDPCTLSVAAFYRLKPGCVGTVDGPDIPDDPCIKIHNWFNNTKFQEKFNNLTKTTPVNVFNLDHELAAYMRYPTVGTNTPPAFVDVDLPSCATDGSLPSFEEGMGGLMHTHNNESCSGGTPIKAPSPTDIQTFVNILIRESMQYTGTYLNAYSLVATSGGNYMLIYTGTNYPGSIDNNLWKKLNKDYTDVFQDLYSDKGDNVTQADIEKVFTKFMKEKINKPGLEVYKVTPTSKIKIEYDPASPNSVKQTPCP